MALGTAMAVGGALAGALGSDGSKKRRRTSSESSADLPDFLKQPIRENVQRGEEAIRGTGFVPMTEQQREGLGRAEEFARGFQPETVSVGNDLARRTLSGEFLDPSQNPGLQGVLDAATSRITDEFQQSVLPQIGSAAQRAGAFGGSRQGIAEGLAAGETARAVGDTASQILGENFARERGLQLATLQQTPALQNATIQGNMVPAQILGNVGQTLRSEQQAAEAFPAQREAQLQDFLTGAAPHFQQRTQRGTTMSRTRQNPLVGAMQGGLGGLQLFNAGQEAGIFS